MRTYKNNMSRQPAGPTQLASSPFSLVNEAAIAARHWGGLEACAAAIDIDSGFLQRNPLGRPTPGDQFAGRAQQKYCGEVQTARCLPPSQASIFSSGSFCRYNGDLQILSNQSGRHLNPGRKNQSMKIRPQEFSGSGRPLTHADAVSGLTRTFGEQVQETLKKLISEGLQLDNTFFSLISSKIEEELSDDQKIRIALKILKTKLRKMKRKSRKVRGTEEKENCRDSTSEQSLDASPKQSGQDPSIPVRPAPDRPAALADLSSPSTALHFLLSMLTRRAERVTVGGGPESYKTAAALCDGKSGQEQPLPTVCADRQDFIRVSRYLNESCDNYAFKQARACPRYAHVAVALSNPV